MQFGKLLEIINGESEEYELVETNLDDVDGSACKEYHHAIIKRLEDSKHFKVDYWCDAGGYGIYPDNTEECYDVEVQKAVIMKVVWKEVK